MLSDNIVNTSIGSEFGGVDHASGNLFMVEHNCEERYMHYVKAEDENNDIIGDGVTCDCE